MCSEVNSTVAKLEREHGLAIREWSTRNGTASVTTVTEFCNIITVRYIDALVATIKRRFSDKAVKLLVSSSIFNPASLPTEASALPGYGKEQV